MDFILVRKIYADVDLTGTHPGLIEKKAFLNAHPSDLDVNSQFDELQILSRDAMNLVYRYKLDQHTYIRVIEELIEVVN